MILYLQLLLCLPALAWAAPITGPVLLSSSLLEASTVYIHELTSHHNAESLQAKTFKLKPTTATTTTAVIGSLVLKVTLNQFNHSLDTTCLSYIGVITGEGSRQLGWTTVSLCNRTLTGILSLKVEGLFILQPAGHGSLHILQRHHFPSHSSQHTTCSTTIPSHPPTTKTNKQQNQSSTTTSHTVNNRLRRHQESVLEKTLKLAVYVDKSLADLHQTNLSTYLLHIMNTVSHLFKDSSLGGSNVVHVQLVKWSIMETKIGKPNSKATEIRDAFCQWKTKQQLNNSPSSSNHNIAILLTRDSICETPQCGVLGISEYRSACQKGRNCIVVKDTGLSTAFIIAHEIGHTLGMYHDGDKTVNCKTDGYYIMASSFQGSSNPHKWSTCSQEQLYDFLSSPESSCLNNPLTNKTVGPPLIGQEYSLNKQCQLLYGDSASSCNKTNCSMLWCSISNGSCEHTQYSPPAGGSLCIHSNGSQGMCYHGNCLSNVSGPIDGGWGQWSDWGACTSTCGQGVQYKSRECNSPMPQFGGKRCTGERITYRLCNNSKCPPHSKGYRHERCSVLGKKRFEVTSLSHGEDENKWISVDPRDLVKYKLNYCQLYCKLTGDHSIFMMENKVPLGTSCLSSHYSPGVCINSKCVQVGCDGKLGTHHYTDQCGVECGDNSSCHKVSFIFTPTIQNKGYQDVITLPSGARDVTVVQKVPSHNIIAAYTHSYKLNGPTNKPYHHHTVNFAHTLWNYNPNKLTTTGPTKEPVALKIYVQDVQSIGTYIISYTIPNKASPWIIGKWSSCSKLCDNGTMTRNVTCGKSEGCDSRTRPTTTATCVNEPCRNFRWITGNWSKCNASCGEGSKTRTIKCQHVNGTEINDKYCTDSKPDDRDNCSKEPCGCLDTYAPSVCEGIVKYGLCTKGMHTVCCKSCGKTSK